MPDTTKPSWACDWCAKEYVKGDFGFNARFSVGITSDGEYAFVLGMRRREDRYVCQDCIAKLENLICPVKQT